MTNFKAFIPNIHKEGLYFVVIALLCAILFSFISSKLTILSLIATVFIIFFFRDPVRVTPVGENYIVSPGDGVITKIEEVSWPEAFNEADDLKSYRVSVFLSVFDVHVNRIPADGKILSINYHKGKFVNAALDKASVDNERNEILMEMKNGDKIIFTQIAGLIARRIVCDVKEDQAVKAGERYGIIRFGSRVDVYLPKGVKPIVFEGQRVIGGETIIADTKEKKERLGEIR